MTLVTDKQTVDDLGIFTRQGKNSVFSVFNKTKTRSGAQILEQMLRYPLSDIELIRKRSGLIRDIKTSGLHFPISPGLLDAAESYLANRDERSRLRHEDGALARKFSNMLGTNSAYRQIIKGIASTIELLATFQQFLQQLENITFTGPYRQEIEGMRQLLGEAGLEKLTKEKIDQDIPYDRAIILDSALRFERYDHLTKILGAIYLLDAYFSIALAATQNNFVFAEVTETKEPFVELKGLVYPGLNNAVANDLEVTAKANIIFLTGANMAGKSTFMKAFGTAMYLAHAGFPVAAGSMRFSVCDVILTTINLADNLHSGYSHFYSEVLRLQKMALQLSNSRNVLIISDELFRGTNVKDAYEGTVAITQALASRTNCIFMVSTHITEAGHALADVCRNIHFIFFPTIMRDNKPFYTHKIENGITRDRYGMVIIEKEGILDILRSAQKQSTSK